MLLYNNGSPAITPDKYLKTFCGKTGTWNAADLEYKHSWNCKKPENDVLWKNGFSCEKPSLQARNSPYDWSFFEKQLISPDLEFQIRF